MQHCERCHQPTNITIMSMFNTQTICMGCKDTEKERADYRQAQDAELKAVQSGDYNFQGTGLK